MDDILQLAERLGKAIASSEQSKTLRERREELDQHEDVKKLLADYQSQVEKVAKLESEQKPVEPDDKRKLDEIQRQLLASDVFKRFTAAQVDFVDLMRKVNERLQSQLSDTPAAATQSPPTTPPQQ